MSTSDQSSSSENAQSSLVHIFIIFLKLGLTSFGGPIAHLAYFREEFVTKRRWLTEHAYADLVALCQFLPGPASSQVGIAIGLSRGGIAGAFASWLGFTLPSFIALVMFAGLLTHVSGLSEGPWLHGLKVVAVAVVAQAIWGMSKTLCPDARRATLAIISAMIVACAPGLYSQLGVIILSGIVGCFWLKHHHGLPHQPMQVPISKASGIIILSVFISLLLFIPIMHDGYDSHLLAMFDSYFRAGSLVFGGGHVVLPLLQAETVSQGWVSNDLFLAGYGAAQAVPGPLFTFAGYLGAVSNAQPNGLLGGGVALAAIFLPAFLLVLGALPLWESIRQYPSIQHAMLGINAAVVGLLIAAFYNPVWTSAILSSQDFGLALLAFLMLMFWKLPPWLVVMIGALAATLLTSAL
ncbi:chromate efflux transporter [Methylophilus sp. TWE2]|uniref:chromate efflux transporter n=1 Tax=Methylophilus sp. TWE2 TaxID=1662285 RepID=UPI000670FAFF|nr:chromate efflux transporter [Methylophilus sp. TWE2]AKR43970.1 chromate transporter [Methylophilus sp. TWE2]